MKRKAALFDSYLDIMGGGEKHILSILQVLEQNGYEVSVFWDNDLKDQIENKLNIAFDSLRFEPNIFAHGSIPEKLKKLSRYDMLLYVTDGSYFLSTAKRNFVFCMVPNKDLYAMNPANRIKTLNFRFIANSLYTASWLRRWSIKPSVIYPYVSDDLIEGYGKGTEKEHMILSVGRFFPHLHTKKHREMIDAFLRFSKSHPDYHLVLAGGIKEEDRGYLEELKTLIGKNRNIRIEANASYENLVDLYKRAKVFWHFAGYGENEQEHPDRVEHLGMTPLEAMAAGAVPFCYKAGGPREIITDGSNGYLFETSESLLAKTASLITDDKTYKNMQREGHEYVLRNFSWDVFKKRVEQTIL